jgi:hypothetical protein
MHIYPSREKRRKDTSFSTFAGALTHAGPGFPGFTPDNRWKKGVFTTKTKAKTPRAAPGHTSAARGYAPRQVTHPPPVPVPRRPCSRFVSRVLYTPVELEELRNISCKSVLQGTIYSAIILFVAKQATLYACCKRLRIRHLQRIRAAGISTYQLSHLSYTTDLLKENEHGHQ